MRTIIYSTLIFLSPFYLIAQDAMTSNSTITINNGSHMMVYGNMYNESGASIVNNGNLEMQEGNFINNSSTILMNGSTGWLEFLSVNGQNITGIFDLTTSNIRLNNTGTGILLQIPTNVRDTLDFVNGLMTSDALNLLTMLEGSIVQNVSNTSHVVGPCRKVGNTAFRFPVGKEGNYRPIEIGAPTLGTDHFTAEYFVIDPEATYGNNFENPIVRISNCEYWQLDRTNGNAAVDVTLTWNNTVSNSLCNPEGSGIIANLTALRVARYDGITEWKNEGNSAFIGNTIQGEITSGAPVTNFSPFTIGTLVYSNLLDQDLIRFEAQAATNHRATLLEWEVSEENTSSYLFEVERSTDAIFFVSIGQVLSKGESIVPVVYDMVDENPIRGWNYYRLRWEKVDGSYEYSDAQAVYFDAEMQFSIYPNPTNQLIHISSESWLGSNLDIEVYSLLGERIYHQQLVGTNVVSTIDLGSLNLPSSTYLLKITDKETGNIYHEKIEFIHSN